jgi:hypothetical protein
VRSGRRGNKGRWWAIWALDKVRIRAGHGRGGREAKAATEGLYTQWVAGFVSGLNWDTTDPDILTELDFDGLMAWVDNYCKANPLAKVTTGAVMLVQELRARAQRK